MAIHSRHASPSNMFTLDKYGKVYPVYSVFKGLKKKIQALKVERRSDDVSKIKFHPHRDELVNEETEAKEIAMAKQCERGHCKSMPPKQRLNVRVSYHMLAVA